MKYRISLAIAAIAAAVHTAVTATEEVLYRAVGSAQATAWQHGLDIEQAVVNKAQAELELARQALMSADKKAKAVLKAHPGRVDAVRAKVFG